MNIGSRVVRILREDYRKLALASLSLLFCSAPTPGDVGGCGQKPAELDPIIFFAAKATIECEQCASCGLARAACSKACQFPEGSPLAFPERCLPLVHDGEVCLRALQYASCDDYGSYMSDTSPSVLTECNFCPEPAP